MKIGTKAWLENELDRAQKELKKAKKEADIACQALHQYRDNLATDVRSLSPNSLMIEDLRRLESGHFYTGKLADETLRKMPLSVNRRLEAYEKTKGKI